MLALLLASAWIAVGACFKLFLGTPADLPEAFAALGKWAGLSKGNLFRLAILVELCVVWIALCRPRLGWKLVLLQYGVFLGLLLVMLAQGAQSCGCLGSKIKLHPAWMLGIDASLAGLLLASRPWRAFTQRGASAAAVLLGAALVCALVLVRLHGADSAATVSPAASSATAADPNGDPAPTAALPEWMTLEPETWIGKTLDQTPIAPYLDLETTQLDATWLIYRINCDHCAKHFLAVHNGFAQAPKQYVLLCLPEQDDEATRVVDETLFPPGAIQLSLPRLARGYDIQTPWELEVQAGKVVAARHVEDE